MESDNRKDGVEGVEGVEGEVFPLTKLPDGLLIEVFSRLESDHLTRCSSVCKKWASLCESVFGKFCTSRGWVLPRLPRRAAGAAVLLNNLSWRALYCRRACYACLVRCLAAQHIKPNGGLEPYPRSYFAYQHLSV